VKWKACNLKQDNVCYLWSTTQGIEHVEENEARERHGCVTTSDFVISQLHNRRIHVHS